MSDLYLEFSHSQIGKSLFESLNLPKPPALYRSPNQSLQLPQGRILVASTKNSFALKPILAAFKNESITLCSPNFKQDSGSQFGTLGKLGSSHQVESINIKNNSNQRFKFLIFDATGIAETQDLKAVYTFFHHVAKTIKKCGRVLILCKACTQEDSILSASLHDGLEGFCKSFAKELGKKGSSCNLVKVEKGAERQLLSTCAFFLSEKSCFITGQTIEARKRSALPRKIDWDKPLAGKVALVTGAAQGIGAETARVLSRDGATVIGLDIPANKTKLDQLMQQISGHSIALDLGTDTAPQELLTTLASQLGLIDIIIHNAGITRDKTLANMPDHFWDQVMRINFEAVVNINQALIDKKLLSERARIVCISSISGIAGNFGQTNYACSKSAIAAYVKHQAKALPPGTSINAIAPGFIETDMTKQIPAMTRQLGRRTNSFSQGGEPLDVAEAISYFCHPASQALNGNLLRVCGQNIMGK